MQTPYYYVISNTYDNVRYYNTFVMYNETLNYYD
jgi:hypothetical protein